MYEKEFDSFGSIIKVDNFQEVCLDEYDDYLDTVIEFKGTKEDMLLIYKKYKDSILKMVLNSDKLKDKIMIEEKRTIRHDKDLEDVANIPEIVENIFEKTANLNCFEERTRNLILLEVAKLINFYGMTELTQNQHRISKEIELGIFSAKTDRYIRKNKLETIKKRIDIDEIFGEESIPYIENFDLLKERIKSLRDFSKIPEEIQQLEDMINQLNLIDEMIEQKNNGVLTLLKQCYSNYERINREMLLNRINTADGKIIDNPNDEELLLLHFLPDFNTKTDYMQDEYFQKSVDEWVKNAIEAKYGRAYNPEIDSEEAGEMYKKYKASKENPFDLSLRIPLKNRYTNSSFYNVITAPHTNLSCSIGKVGSLNPHLDRKIAIGFSLFPINAIKTINKGYNNALDSFSFEQNSVPLPEVLEHIEDGGTNETLVDWTQIKSAYILIVKDNEEISEDLLMKAEEYSNISGLPIQIYDSYEIKRRKDNPQLNQGIEGAYNVSDLSLFAQTKSKGNLLQVINMMKNKSQEMGDIQK